MTEHGSREAYQSGCHCTPCRSANASYSATRARALAAGEWNGRVDATPARDHLASLQSQGIGIPHIAALAGVSTSTLWSIRSGRQVRLRMQTLRLLLAIPARPALGSLTGAWRTKRLIRVLLGEGFSRCELAQRAGLRGLRFRGDTTCVRLRTALSVQRLYRVVTEESELF